MRVVIGRDAADCEECLTKLIAILQKVEVGWHIWEVINPESLEDSMLVNSIRTLKELHEKATVCSIYPPPEHLHTRRVLVTFNSSETDSLPPDAALNYLTTPLYLLMENRNTDGTFLDAVLDVLSPPDLKELLGHSPPPLHKDSPGGNGELPKLIDEYISEAEASGHPVRIVVFTDSDARFPGDVQTNPQLVKRRCEETGTPFCLLKKRNIENYIPDEVFDSWCAPPSRTAGRPFVAALKNLSTTQRDYFYLKDGLRKAKSLEEDSFYDSISEEDKRTLESGFQGEPISLLRSERESLTAEAFRHRDGEGELDGLVRLIGENL